MSRKPTRPSARTQGSRASRGVNSSIRQDALLAARRQLEQAKAERAARATLSKSERRQSDRAIASARNAELRAQLAQVRALGLYTPKGNALTKGRKEAIRKAARQAEALTKGAIFVAKPTRSKSAWREIGAKVRAQGGTVTRKGAFLPREGGELSKGSAKLVRDPETGMWVAEQVYHYTDREGHRRTVSASLFLDGPEALSQQQEKLRKRFDRLQSTLGKNEAIRFTIGGPQGNVSRASFRTWDAFERRVMAYRRDPRAQATFLASLTVYVARHERDGVRSYRVPVAWADKAGRRRDASPENLYPGGLFPAPKRRKPQRRK